MTQSFDTLYRAFEDKFRGSPDLIKERLRVYLPLLQQLPADVGGGRRAVDLGCGRGEWLEVVSEAGFEPVGVDLNAGMAQAALDRGFSVEIDDALAFMRRQEAASASVVTAFHLAEHLPIETLLDLLNECHRVLGDGGLLILETPNPENISVGTWTFYIDPTHQKPLPPTLLEFLVQQAGFDRTAILRINGADVDETAGAMEQAFQTMFDTARDYACLAHKQSGEAQDILSPFVDAATQPNPANMDPLNHAVRKTEAEIRSLHERNTEQIGAVMDELREAHRREMASRDEVVAAHRADLDRLRRDIENAAAAHAQQVAALQADLAARQTAIDAHETEIERLRGRIADTDKAHAQQVVALQADLAERDAAIAERRAETDRLHRDIENAAAAHAQQLAVLQADLGARQTAIEGHQAEIERLHGRIADTDKAHAQQVATLQTDLADRDAALAERRAEIDRLHHQIATTEANHARELATRQNDAAAHDAAVAAYRSEAERVQRAFDDAARDHAGQLAAFHADLAKRDATLAARLAKIERLHARDADGALTERLAALQADITARDAAIAEHAGEAERLRQHLAEAEAAHEQALAAYQAELAARDEVVAAHHADLDRLGRDMESAAAAHAQQIAALQADLAARDDRLAELSHAHDLASRHGGELGQEIAALRASTSWRVTAPLRAASRAVRWLMRGPRWFAGGVWAWITFKPGSRPRRVLRLGIIKARNVIASRPRLKSQVAKILRRYPKLFARLRSVTMEYQTANGAVMSALAQDESADALVNDHYRAHIQHRGRSSESLETCSSSADDATWWDIAPSNRSVDDILARIREELAVEKGESSSVAS